MTALTATFKSLMSQVDDDYDLISDSAHKRVRLYYSIEIDGRETEVIARKLGNRLSFLIKTPQKNSSYTLLYLSELDVIEILSRLDNAQYKYIRKFAAQAYLNQLNTNRTVNLKRESFHPSIEKKVITANNEVITIPDYEGGDGDVNIETPFGFDISLRTFCDNLSLMLSTENTLKLKIVLTKYCIFSELIRSSANSHHVPTNLSHIKTIGDINKIYSRMRFQKQQQEYDKRTFTPKVGSVYFETID